MWETGWQGHSKEGAKPDKNAYYYTTFAVLTSSQNAATICFAEWKWILFTFVQVTKSDKSK